MRKLTDEIPATDLTRVDAEEEGVCRGIDVKATGRIFTAL
jgi:hypothetical protein